jgi:hypothetical protein
MTAIAVEWAGTDNFLQRIARIDDDGSQPNFT